MLYLLYLRRSFLRRPRRHFSLFIILTCAFILPLFISIYRDSSAYGNKLQIRNENRGAAFHIDNASPEDTEIFEGIDGLTPPRYEDGTIYLHFLSEEDWMAEENMMRCGDIIMNRIRQSGRTDLYAKAYHDTDFSLIKRNSYEGFSQEDIEYVQELAPVMEIRCRRTVADEGGDPYANEVYGIDIRLISPEQNREAEALLLERFSGAGYEIRNFAAQTEQGRQMSKGIFLMLTFIFSAMFLFTLVIVSMKLGDYIGDSSGTIKTLSSIGAPKGMIKGSYVRQSAISAGFAALLPAAGSILLFIPATAAATQKLTVTPALILVYLAVMAVTAAAFILPVSHAVNQLFKRREQVL